MMKELPKNWVEVSLQDVTKNVKGKKPKIQLETEFEGSIPYMDIKALEYNEIRQFADVESSKLFEEGDVAMVWDGARSGWVSKTNFGAIGSTLVAFKPLKINSNYLFYYLLEKYPYINSNARGVGIPHVAPTVLWSLGFPLPPLTEQNRIVAKLDSLFTQLESIKSSMAKIPVLLKNFRQQILTQAVTGKLTEEWREGKDLERIYNHQIADKLNLEVRELNGKNISSGRSKIKINPINFVRQNEIDWNYYTVESLAIAIVDCLHETAEFSQNGYKIIDTNNIEAFKINELKLRFVKEDIYKKWTSRLQPEYGDIVFTREGTIGNALMIPENDAYCIGQRTMVFRFTKLLESRFCEYYLNSEPFKRQYKPLIKGVASQHINIRDLRILEMPIPSISEQQEIVSRVESLFAQADAIEEKYKNLKAKIETLPQAILHKAFKGELTEQLETDGDARDLLDEIAALKNEGKTKNKVIKSTNTIRNKADEN